MQSTLLTAHFATVHQNLSPLPRPARFNGDFTIRSGSFACLHFASSSHWGSLKGLYLSSPTTKDYKRPTKTITTPSLVFIGNLLPEVRDAAKHQVGTEFTMLYGTVVDFTIQSFSTQMNAHAMQPYALFTSTISGQ